MEIMSYIIKEPELHEMIIECNFEENTPDNVKKLFFDLGKTALKECPTLLPNSNTALDIQTETKNYVFKYDGLLMTADDQGHYKYHIRFKPYN